MSEIALVVIDVQWEFCDPRLPAGIGTLEKALCVPGIFNLLKYARQEKWRIFHVGTCHKDAATIPNHLRRRGVQPFCCPGSKGREFLVSPLEEEPVIFKESYSAFCKTSLDVALDGVSALVVSGLAADCCVRQTVFEADALGFESYVPLEAVSASTISAFSAGLVSISKSAGEVIELSRLTRGTKLQEIAIPTQDVESIAKGWYENNLKKHDIGKDKTLDELLALWESPLQ